MQEFIPSTNIDGIPPQNPSNSAEPHRESVLITLVGSTVAMDLIIKHLHKLGFVESNAWSKEQTEPKSGQSMRVLKKWIRV
ncbi:MAG: hypothetical protein ACFB2W_26340 [Leptolyngbyaceae cyanobacterium]